MLQTLDAWLGDLEGALFQHVVLPVVYALGLGGYAEDAFAGTEWLVVGLLQLTVMVALLCRWSGCVRSSRSPIAPRSAPT